MREHLEWVYEHSMIPAAILEWDAENQVYLIGFMTYAGLKVGFAVEEHDVTDRRTLLADLQTLYGNFIQRDYKTYRSH